MSKYLRTLSSECVARRLSLVSNRQGYTVSVYISLDRQISTTTVRSQCFSAINKRYRNWITEGIIKRTMGGAPSKGKKGSSKKNDPKQASTSVEHDKLASGDAKAQNDEEWVEGEVCKESDLEENQMKVFELGKDEGRVLLVRQKGKIHALGTKCTHYGAPLEKGALGDGRIRCQWHGACFNIANGDIEDFPGFDSLPCYQVTVNNGNVRVRARREDLKTNKRIRGFTARDENNKNTFIVVGGGAAGANCVETLRQNGYSGKLILVNAEPYLPYDRVKLSKALDVDVSKISLRSADFYKDRHIEVMLSKELTALNPTAKSIKLNSGEELKYDKLFLATGSTPRTITAPGSDLKNVFVLRTYDDASKIKQALTPSANVVILGSSFIGMEAAAYCVDKARSVTVVARDNVPFKPSFGPIIGARVLKLFEEKGVKFQLESSIVSFEGEDGTLTSVTLKNGTKLPANLCLIGIGVTPNTNYLASAGAKLQRNGSIEVNEFLETEWPDVYAGGDIASAPILGQNTNKVSIGHWGLANYHGHIAAFNMLGIKKPVKSVPFFWTVLFGKSFRYTGFAQKFDEVVIDGDVAELTFAAYFCAGDNVVAITTINRDPLAAKFAELLHQGKTLQKSKISNWFK